MTSSDEHADPVEGLLEECLEAPPERRQETLDRLCEEHPEHAADLRDRYRQLLDAGLL